MLSAKTARSSTKKQSGEGRSGLPRFRGKFLKTCRKKLERQPETELHLPGVVALGVYDTKG
jgi:hypothetical protein